jgi:pectate lyase
MKKKTIVLATVAWVVVSLAQAAFAQFVTNTVQNAQSIGINFNFSTLVSSLDRNGGSDFATGIRNAQTSPTAGTAGKAWLQFNLSNAWAAYHQANLVSATLSIWNENGTTRQFDVAGLADNSGLENWTSNSITSWTNAPGNDVTSGYAFDPAQIFGGTNVWEERSGIAPGHDVANATYTQMARYDSSDYPNSILDFLRSDTDGKVTFMISGSSINNNETILIGAAGAWMTGSLPTLSSPTLTLVFAPQPASSYLLMFTNIMPAGGNIILQGRNGPSGGAYQVLYATDLTQPLVARPSLGIQAFDANGNFSFTNSFPADAARFYQLEVVSPTAAPLITTQPQNLSTTVGQTANFSVANEGVPPMTYQWYFNTNTVLPGQTNVVLTLTNVQTTNAGMYSVAITNQFGHTNSTFAALTVNPANNGPNFSLVGWATLNGGTTGGADGSTQTVTTASALQSAVQSAVPLTVQVSGTIDIRSISDLNVAANKTLVGLGTNATLLGDLGIYGVSNVIVQNLHLSNVGSGTNNNGGAGSGDGITMQGSRNVWIDHCTFSDCADGSCDITHACDFVTVSWCRFYYTTNHNHDFVGLVGHSDDNAAEDTGHLRVTFQHNWYDTLCKERMPRVRYGQVHIFNNYYGCTNNDYCVAVGVSSQIVLENSYFDDVNAPWSNYSPTNYVQGLIHWNNDNVYVNTTVPTWAPNSTVFTPPYAYALDPGSSVKTNVINYAGMGQGPFAP